VVILFGAGCGKKEKPARERTGGWGEELSSNHIINYRYVGINRHKYDKRGTGK